MGNPSSPSLNLSIISRQTQYLSVTNTPVNTVQPVCEVLKKENHTRYSYKQWFFSGLAGKVCYGAVCVLITLFLTDFLSVGFIFCLWFLHSFLSFGFIHETGAWGWIPILVPPGFILTKHFPKTKKAVAVVCLIILALSLGALGLINRDGLSYLDDYSYPEYLVSSTSKNIVVVHEKIDLPYSRSYKKLLFREGRMTYLSTNELATLLQAQAEEIRLFRQANPPQKVE